MKVACWMIGKTDAEWVSMGMAIYEKRLKNYFPFEAVALPDSRVKSRDADSVKKAEAQALLARILPDDYVVLLDERGAQYSSEGLARWMERRLNDSRRRLIFIIGGAWGFDDAVYARANERLSLSSMTFSHQMIRPFFFEQLYRAMTILRNEPYHNP